MCGFAGFLGMTEGPPLQIVERMVAALAHRGPDSFGTWADPDVPIALGHRRLSIVDLSPQGHQPMASFSGRYIIVFNGEIYNYELLRRELEKLGAAPSWRGHSDTEVLLAAVEHWGLVGALKRFTGMFAFALLDRAQHTLHLVRDRLGEKPLYYGCMGTAFLFGSELKALKAHPAWRGEISRNSIALLMRHNYIPTPFSIYNGIFKLPPGTYLSLPIDNVSGIKKGSIATLCPQYYWSAREISEKGMENPFAGSEDEAVQHLDQLLRNAVSQQMVADVPLGAFLSGGIDSSTIVALMQAQSSRRVKTFTIGFNEQAYDEAHYAAEVARHLGTDHETLYVSSAQALNVIPELPAIYDEPFSDSSQIPTLLVAQLARQHVTVSLSGDGGDELFGGYNRYLWANRIWQKLEFAPHSLRVFAASALRAVSPEKWDKIFSLLGPFLPLSARQRLPGVKVHKIAGLLDVESQFELYLNLISHWTDPTSLVLNAIEPNTVLNASEYKISVSNFTESMMYLDTVSYLPDDILTKVDRASMATSLESRVPFLDHNVVEFAMTLPLSMKISGGQGKHLLRKVLYSYVPKELIERPKMGFGIPIDSWLRGPLRDWAEALLNEKRLKEEGFFDVQQIRKKWEEHLSGMCNWQYHLWDVLIFQAWLEAQ